MQGWTKLMCSMVHLLLHFLFGNLQYTHNQQIGEKSNYVSSQIGFLRYNCMNSFLNTEKCIEKYECVMRRDLIVVVVVVKCTTC